MRKLKKIVENPKSLAVLTLYLSIIVPMFFTVCGHYDIKSFGDLITLISGLPLSLLVLFISLFFGMSWYFSIEDGQPQ